MNYIASCILTVIVIVTVNITVNVTVIQKVTVTINDVTKSVNVHFSW